MKFLNTSEEIETEIRRQINKCKQLRWAVAWATVDCPLFKLLKQKERKIHRLIVGTTSNLTDPGFIEAFLHNDNFVVMEKPEVLFHPKLYFFEHPYGSWDCIIGSPNFTHAAFSSNIEVAVHFSHCDGNVAGVRDQITSSLEGFFRNGVHFDEAKLSEYRIKCEQSPPIIKQVSSPLPRLLNMYWPEYFALIQKKDQSEIDERLAVLEKARELFETEIPFCQWDPEDRKGIAGWGGDKSFRWEWFGGKMQRVQQFNDAISKNNKDGKAISNSLNKIGSTGEITYDQFRKYLDIMRKSFSKDSVATVTRLLAMKRPDYFICISGANRDRLCHDLGLDKPNSLSLDDYWEKIVRPIITESNWWKEKPKLTNRLERRIWECRVAFLDVLCYQPD